ncbi:MAG: hypothetical protein M1839_005412 [Geoglossum umbratile]|nr:MAG: hypothetical protein M1839_005412 [Geoglossum umbratile]
MLHSISRTYKFRWQLFTIFFPGVLVATAAEQWLSARQSVSEFAAASHYEWTIRHGFFADMGGIKVAPPDSEPFPVDSQQLAYLVKHKYLPMPEISTDDIRNANKTDELGRAVTFLQMAWFSLTCVRRGAARIGLSSIELTTLAFILCALHTFFFWYYKPLDPDCPRVLTMDTPVSRVRRDVGAEEPYIRTPLDFIKPPPDPRSLVTPFWFSFGVVFCAGEEAGPRPVQTLANSKANPPEGIGWGLTAYLVFFQIMYYGLHLAAGWTMSFPSKVEWFLWKISDFTEFGLIAVYILALPLGTYFAPFIGQNIFRVQASSILEVASMLPYWAKLLIHGPFVLAYIAARVLVLAESIISLRALPAVVYQDVSWSSFLPHV